jgi:hypothetical protein
MHIRIFVYPEILVYPNLPGRFNGDLFSNWTFPGAWEKRCQVWLSTSPVLWPGPLVLLRRAGRCDGRTMDQKDSWRKFGPSYDFQFYGSPFRPTSQIIHESINNNNFNNFINFNFNFNNFNNFNNNFNLEVMACVNLPAIRTVNQIQL